MCGSCSSDKCLVLSGLLAISAEVIHFSAIEATLILVAATCLAWLLMSILFQFIMLGLPLVVIFVLDLGLVVIVLISVVSPLLFNTFVMIYGGILSRNINNMV